MTKYIWWQLFKICKVLVLAVHHPIVKDRNHKKLKCGVFAKGSSCRLKYQEAVARWIPWTSRRDEISSIETEFITWNYHIRATCNELHYFGGTFCQDHINNFPWKPRWSCCWWKWSLTLKPLSHLLKKWISNYVGFYFPSDKHPESQMFIWTCINLIKPSGRKPCDGEIRFLPQGISVLHDDF